MIRVRRPYSFSYGEKHSPVAYIGKGHAQERITSHLKSCIPRLCDKIPDLMIAIDFCEPRIRKKGTICEDVEADLIKYFVDSYGELQLRNKNTPRGALDHTYDLKEITKVIHPGKGQGYEWAIRPLPSSNFFKPKKWQRPEFAVLPVDGLCQLGIALPYENEPPCAQVTQISQRNSSASTEAAGASWIG